MSQDKTAKVALIGSEKEENLSIRYLGASLEEENHRVELVPYSSDRDLEKTIDQVKRFQPDLVGISIPFQSEATIFFQLIKKLRAKGYDQHLTLGGHFPTFEYKKILGKFPEVDSVVRFEGEKPIVQLAEFCLGEREISQVKNLVYRQENEIRKNETILEFPDLEDIPYPIRDKEPDDRLGENFATLLSSRGCWHASCLYCCIGAFHSEKKNKKFKAREPESIAKEIIRLYNKRDIRLFQFHDDNFTMPTKLESLDRFERIKKKLAESDIDRNEIAFLIKARPDSINQQVAKKLKELGVVGVFLGVENASQSGLNSLIRGTQVEDIERSLKALQDQNIGITYNLLLFHPQASLNEINKNIQFIKNNLENPFDFGRAEIVAGSPLERQVKQESLIEGSWPEWSYKIKDDATQQLFCLYSATFDWEGTLYNKLAHKLIALNYHTYILNRLYPGPVSDKIHQETKSLIKRSNKFILDKLFDLYKLGGTIESEEELVKFNKSLHSGVKKNLQRARKLSGRMNRLQRAESKARDWIGLDSIQQSGLARKILEV